VRKDVTDLLDARAKAREEAQRISHDCFALSKTFSETNGAREYELAELRRNMKGFLHDVLDRVTAQVEAVKGTSGTTNQVK
jgi:predicted translin family RNA/ssDNA-binding protein